MKKICFVIIALICGSTALNAQSGNGLGFFTEEEIRERDAINNKQKLQNDTYYQEMTNRQYKPNLYQQVNKAVSRAQNGVRIETTAQTSKSPSGNRTPNKQRQQAQKANSDAEHLLWLEQRRQTKAFATERRHLEEHRKREERQRKHDRIFDSELQRTSAIGEKQQAIIQYRATEGKDFMYNHQPQGTEKIQSGYISSSSSSYDIAAIISKSSQQPIRLSLTGNETVKYTDYEEEWLKSLKRIDLSQQAKVIFNPSEEEKKWEAFQGKLSKSHADALNYFLTNGKENPQLAIINQKGEYVFETNDGTKLFVVSPNGNTLSVYSLEEHFWDDDNIVQKIKSGELNIKDSFEFDYPSIGVNTIDIKGSKVKYKDLKDLKPDELKKFLPQIKAELKSNIADNSSTLSFQQFHFSSLNPTGSLASWLTDSYFNMTDVEEMKLTFSGGGKAEIKGKVATGASSIFSIGGSMKFSVLEVGGTVSKGSIVAIGDQSYMFKVKGDGEIGAGIAVNENSKSGPGAWKYQTKKPIYPGVYAGCGIQIEVKNITKKKGQDADQNIKEDKT